jgi:hypothetical protein
MTSAMHTDMKNDNRLPLQDCPCKLRATWRTLDFDFSTMSSHEISSLRKHADCGGTAAAGAASAVTCCEPYSTYGVKHMGTYQDRAQRQRRRQSCTSSRVDGSHHSSHISPIGLFCTEIHASLEFG